MKKWFSVMLALVLAVSLAACAKNNEKQAGQSSGKLIVGFDAEFPPFGFIAADGSYDGFDLALAKEACSRLGWDFEAVAIDWNSKDAELAAGSINCIWNGFTVTGREDEYTWSQGTVDAVAVDKGVAAYQLSVNGEGYVMLEEAISQEQYAVGFFKGNTELRDAVNEQLWNMAKDGTMLEIAQKYEDKGLVLDSLCMLGK